MSEAKITHKGASDAVYARCSPASNHPLAAVLTLAVVAILSHHLSVLAIAQWGRRQSPAILVALGFPDGVTPHQTTVQRLLSQRPPT